ncbi:MAG: response regulator transcription factor [Leptolyngbya sp. SIO1D8]|nr:response regulator transcription factor [Leptolyngbya sp. SIO1D8]
MLTYGKVALNSQSCTTTYNGCEVRLNPKEYELLELFLKYPSHVLSYDAIIDRVWEGESVPTYGCIRTHIKRLRKAFKAVEYPGEIIENVHSLGYRLKPLPKETMEVISPPNSVLRRFFSAKAIEYLVVDNGQIVRYLSPGIVRYSDYPTEIRVGAAVDDGFPEFIGLETVFKKILNQQQESFELKGIAREQNPERPEYINFYVIADRDHQSLNRLFIFFEDASDHMLSRQRLVQRSNETVLLLERLQATEVPCQA